MHIQQLRQLKSIRRLVVLKPVPKYQSLGKWSFLTKNQVLKSSYDFAPTSFQMLLAPKRHLQIPATSIFQMVSVVISYHFNPQNKTTCKNQPNQSPHPTLRCFPLPTAFIFPLSSAGQLPALNRAAPSAKPENAAGEGVAPGVWEGRCLEGNSHKSCHGFCEAILIYIYLFL